MHLQHRAPLLQDALQLQTPRRPPAEPSSPTSSPRRSSNACAATRAYRSCLFSHDNGSAEVECMGKGAGSGYETLWGCCGKTVDRWYYEATHASDRSTRTSAC
ncbi:hypothetical protein DFH09DRAFT_227457 [Mycena vulgaris]|nr:hypothetical protein DFH09DRAFT_227457 [Mycena vulgaris]